MKPQASSKLPPPAGEQAITPKRLHRTELEAIIRILIVENQGSLRRDYVTFIREIETKLHESGRRIGFEVADVGCAADAMQKFDLALKTKPFDIMFLDLGIPERDGGGLSVGRGIKLGEVAQEKGCVKRTVVLSGELENLTVGSAIKLVDSGAKFVEKTDIAVHDAIAQEVEKSVLHGAIFEEIGKWKREATSKSAEIFAHRIRCLAAYAERSLVYTFGLCFSRCLQDVNRAMDAIQNESKERFGFDSEGTPASSLDEQLRAIGDSLKNGRQDWAELQTSLGLGRLASPQHVNVREMVDEIRNSFDPCLTFKVASIQAEDVENETVISFDGEVNTILSEMILGALAECPPEMCDLRFSSQPRGDWVEVTLEDNLAPLSPADVAKINEGIGIFAGARFSRAWGLSVMQHVALRGGGRLTVETAGEGNTIKYRIPRARNGQSSSS